MKPSELYTELTSQTGLFNIQAIDNIPSIMRWGLLSNEKAARIKHTKLVFATDWRDENQFEYFKKKSIKCAEVLIPYFIPFDYVVCAAVYSEEAKQKLETIGFSRKIYVEPKFFF